MADLDLYDEMYLTLIRSGWIVAMSSYRRQGKIVKDAMLDTCNLRDYIAKKYGEPELVLLEGESMGGHVVTLIAERDPQRFNGVLAIGAALISKKEVWPF